MSQTSIKICVRSNIYERNIIKLSALFTYWFSLKKAKRKSLHRGWSFNGLSAVSIKMLQWFYFYNTVTILSLFPHIVQSYTYELLSLLLRGRNASIYFFALLVLQRNTMCQQNMSHEAEVLCSDVYLQKESHSIDVQVQTLRSDQTAASVRRY